MTPLMLALTTLADRNAEDPTSNAVVQDIVKMILDHPLCDADVLTQKDNRLRSALGYATYYDLPNILERMLNHPSCKVEHLVQEQLHGFNERSILMDAAIAGLNGVAKVILKNEKCVAEVLSQTFSKSLNWLPRLQIP